MVCKERSLSHKRVAKKEIRNMKYEMKGKYVKEYVRCTMCDVRCENSLLYN
jgi:hypothetical protein